jgi:hypothetical protein
MTELLLALLVIAVLGVLVVLVLRSVSRGVLTVYHSAPGA